MPTVRAQSRVLPCLAIALMLAATSARGDEPLRWKFAKGQALHYTMTQKTTTKVEVNGQKLDNNLSQEIDMTWAVKSVDDKGNAEMEQTLDRIVFSMNGPVGDIKVDTSKPAEEGDGPLKDLTKLFYAMVDKPFHLKMNPRGEISDVKVPEKLVEALKGAGPVAANNPLFSEEGLKRMINQASLVLPENAVKKGETWKSKKSFPLPPLGTIATDSVYTYDGATGDDEKIGVVTKTEIQPGDGAAFEIKIVNQENTGSFHFDRKAGKLRGSEMSQAMTMQISVNNQEIVQDIVTTTRMDEAKAQTGK